MGNSKTTIKKSMVMLVRIYPDENFNYCDIKNDEALLLHSNTFCCNVGTMEVLEAYHEYDKRKKQIDACLSVPRDIQNFGNRKG